MEYTIDDIETIAILVQIKGNSHQVLTTKENKEVLLRMLSSLDGGLKLDTALAPVEFVKK